MIEMTSNTFSNHHMKQEIDYRKKMENSQVCGD